MNKERFLNKEIINKNNERGFVVSFDDGRIVIRYENSEVAYFPDIAFKNKFLSFKDNSLNLIIEEDLSIKEEIKLKHENELENKRKMIVNKTKETKEIYKKISEKNRVLQSLFGSDFRYPPFIEFKKKYSFYIKRII